MLRVTRLVPLLALLGLGLIPTTTLDVESAGVERKPAHHLRRGFRNLDDRYRYDMGVRMRHFVLDAFTSRPPRGAATPVIENDGAALRANGTHPTVTWVGHSTFLVQLDGVNILTDPHWGDRASPVGIAGPRRLVPPGLRFEDLPPIHAVVISHDHYDHLDTPTIEGLAPSAGPGSSCRSVSARGWRGRYHRRGRAGLVGQRPVPGPDPRVHPGAAFLGAHPHRPVRTTLVVVGRPGADAAILLRRGHWIRSAAQDDRRSPRPLRSRGDSDRKAHTPSRRGTRTT